MHLLEKTHLLGLRTRPHDDVWVQKKNETKNGGQCVIVSFFNASFRGCVSLQRTRIGQAEQ